MRRCSLVSRPTIVTALVSAAKSACRVGTSSACGGSCATWPPVAVVARAGVEEPQESQVPYLVEFRDWIHSHRGLAAQTISRYERDLSRLLPALGRDTTRYDAALIRQVICTEARVRCAATARTIANSLRAYLRFLASRGHCVPGLD